MTVNASRSQNAELAEGATDGTYKKIVTDRGGFIDPANVIAKKTMIPTEVYGLVGEIDPKMMPDGRMRHTPNAR